MHIAVDGSPLLEQPSSPSGLHLIEWMMALDSAGAHVTLLHAMEQLPPIPEQISTYAIPTPRNRLRFEQRDLPRAAGELDVDLLLVGEGRVPLASPCPVVAVSSIGRNLEAKGFLDSLAFAAGRAGSRGARAVLHSGDAGSPSGRTAYPPFVARAFADEAVGMGDSYVLCHGYDAKDLPLILSAWTWVDGSMGDGYPLVIVGADAALNDEIESISSELDVAASVSTQPAVSYRDLPQLYRSAAAYIGTAFTADGQDLRWALASGVPVIGLQTPEFESVLGDAAYLVPPGDSRSLGAACLTVLIQERVSDPLREKGHQRSDRYTKGGIARELMDLLAEVTNLGSS